MKNNDTLEIGIYDEKNNIFHFTSLNDCFPQNKKFIRLGVKWKTSYHPWYEETYPLENFYSSVIEKQITYPKTYKELLINLKTILEEHATMGTLGINDEDGEFCPLTYKAENKFINILDEILNSKEVLNISLPIYN